MRPVLCPGSTPFFLIAFNVATSIISCLNAVRLRSVSSRAVFLLFFLFLSLLTILIVTFPPQRRLCHQPWRPLSLSLQGDINTISSWCSNWLLSLNVVTSSFPAHDVQQLISVPSSVLYYPLISLQILRPNPLFRHLLVRPC